jgi:hypothetical protein
MSEGVRRCQWSGGCKTILRASNKTGLCGACEKRVNDEKILKRGQVSRREEVDSLKYTKISLKEADLVERVFQASRHFYGASCENNGGETSFALKAAIYLLHADYQLAFEVISFNLKCNLPVVVRSYHEILSKVGQNPELRRNLDLIRKSL